jgi:hypothetical protein
MDDQKVKAILDWEPPRLVPTLRSFLGLASYYCKFIKNFAKITTPLTNLLKNHPELMNGMKHAMRPLKP